MLLLEDERCLEIVERRGARAIEGVEEVRMVARV
jgi:hypothetical protein